ncbi:MAG: hypothetical protein R3321_00650 [Nitrososphaeraceae archaeon]|nr:hypothetical protein [Nitrososphaeraceae archaeon]
MYFAYLYKINFLDNPLNYYKGSRRCPKGVLPQDDNYMGSPVTHKSEWNRPIEKEIIIISASENKKELDTHIRNLEIQYISLNDLRNPNCYNEARGYRIKLEYCREGGYNVHKQLRDDGLTHNEWINSWLHNEKDELGRSLVSMKGFNAALKKNPNLHSKAGKASAARIDENGNCIMAKNLNKRCWKCLETGYISTAGGLTQYQKARGINTKNRIKIN